MNSKFGKGIVFLAVLLLAVQTASAQEKISVLIIDGQNNHNWKATTPVLKRILEESDRFTVEVATTPAQGAAGEMAAFKPDFAKYDVLVMNYTGDDWPAETKKTFEKYVADGGGLVIYHAANNAFANWPAYNEMIAIGGWGGRNEKSGPYLYWEDGKLVRASEPGPSGHHGPQWEFLIDVREPEHPIMKGLPLSFRHVKDELYDFLRGPAKNVTILATAYADKEQGGSGRHEPQLMVIDYGKGRVFHHCLGHDQNTCRGVSFIVTFLRGTEWAATGKVTIPVPDDMPGPDRPVSRKFD
jgi:type 1 glutamine amidotransferase